MVEPLRLACEDDIPALAALHESSFAKFWTEQSFRALLPSPGCFGLLTQDAFILARVAADEAEILTLAVHPAARGKGLGRWLVAEAAAHAAQNGAERMFLEVAAANAPARALYHGLGFAQAGMRKAYYEGADGLVLKADLPLAVARLGNAAKTD